MKFGYAQVPHDVTKSRPYTNLLDELRELAEYCDEAGFSTFWLPEHHFSIWGREMLPNPLLVAADLAARTKRIRIGLGAAIITFWHPLRLAEDLALLDQISNGRLEIGFGRGNYGLEATNLNPAADPNNQQANFKIFEESIGVVRAALGNQRFSYKGDFYQFPAPGFKADRAHTVNDPAYVDPETNELVKLSLIPGSKQKPMPPMWLMVSESHETMRFAAQNDMGMVMWRPTVQTLKERLKFYQSAYREIHGIDIPLGAKAAISRDTFVAESMAEARKIAEGPLMGALNFSNWRGPRIYLNPGETLEPEQEAALKKKLTFEFVDKRSLFFGSPDDVIARVKELYTETRMEEIIFHCSWPGLAHEHARRSCKMLTEHVFPALRAWHAKTFPTEAAA
ncbi:LLM class flavin-dependent oxidoreductase [Dongia soli]|uniref:LLM class flavin-dependent oxidoreductase n=1 Tax=Dongia soli TaxID=600628 RepID=A0ABU5EDK1_9PROT|nr:LLM class flavin-dependent oxidoreductase [Dongia soli]MDY0884387.1 LLM class flavin-dependent oxidoreductase [Dongia soli]